MEKWKAKSFGLLMFITVICCLGVLAVCARESLACTGIRMMPKDGSVIHARTLEFAAGLYYSNIIIIPRGLEFTGQLPTGSHGMKWKTKYGMVGMDQIGYPLLTDGLNEAGLGAGLFSHRGFAVYQPFVEGNEARSFSPYDLVTWMLSMFATVDEVKAAIDKVTVVPVKIPKWGFVQPLHFVVHDKSGKCIVIEYLDGKLTVYDNPLGIMANSPTFDWHLVNLRNYMNLYTDHTSQREIMGLKMTPFGYGLGLHGLPGDFSSPSRFVRAAYITAQSPQEETAFQGVIQAFHILNQFDVPKGAYRTKSDKTKISYGETAWTIAADLSNGRYYFHTNKNRRIRMIDIKKVNLTGPAIVTISLKADEEDILDLTPGQSK